MPQLGATGWNVFPLCLGTNVFGWTADAAQSFAVLDAYVAAGGNFIDTADQYSAFAPGNQGGESEAIIGRWLAARRNRDDVILATKVGRKPGLEGLAPATIRTAVADSLRRLQTDHVDLLYAHADDPQTPLEETLGAFGELVQAGAARHIAASNYAAPRLTEALAVSAREGLPRYVALQSHYSLVDRERYEGPLRDLCAREGLPCAPYWGLARGFLTGKYRAGGPAVDSPRAAAASAYLDARGLRVLEALDEVAAAHAAPVAAVALAWLAAQPTVVAPIASARTPDQLRDLLAVAELQLTDADLSRLASASGGR
jgi:aryl-alcohol dehydrogenase (NADP+)